MSRAKVLCCSLWVVVFPAVLLLAEEQTTMSLAQRRQQILQITERTEANIEILDRALTDESPVIRRIALRVLSDWSKDSDLSRIEKAFREDDDVLVRRIALEALVKRSDQSNLSYLEWGLRDESDVIRLYVVQTLIQYDVRQPYVLSLLKQAAEDSYVEVRSLASKALWPFYRDSRSVRDRPEFQDMHLQVVQVIALPKEGWLFKTDPEANSHESGWYLPEHPDQGWQRIAIEQTWEAQGVDYDGVAWYRYRFQLPEKKEMDGVDIVFEGVDESAWVWINGEYVGEHDIGSEGWNQKFSMGVTEFLKWGEENLLTVRVLDRKLAGGIWKPVYLEVLRR